MTLRAPDPLLEELKAHPQPVPAELRERVLATLIDVVVFTGFWRYLSIKRSGPAEEALSWGVTLALFVSYFIFGWGSGQTMGKRILGTRVIDRETWQPIARQRAAIRFLAWVPMVVALGLPLRGAARDEWLRGWHDGVAGSMVLEDDSIDPSVLIARPPEPPDD